MELEQLYKDIQPNIYAFFYVKTLSKEVSEDLTQEVFYQAIKGYQGFAGLSNVKTWVFAIAKNVLKKYYRSNRYRNGLTEQLQLETLHIESSEEHFMKREEKRQLIQLIHQLDELSKEVVTLRIYGELSFKEIGDLLEKSENYARIMFHRAKLKMQKELSDDEG
ncbi:MAG: RNA polymerase sigma factor [Anaerobacillus sp.]|uniref:RNA polymerase sigma factor n=1 Tax=Anaerobacillus sp. TaxID=1872506 RepID=UPI003919550F